MVMSVLEICFVLGTKVHSMLVTERKWVDVSLRSVLNGVSLPLIG